MLSDTFVEQYIDLIKEGKSIQRFGALPVALDYRYKIIADYLENPYELIINTGSSEIDNLRNRNLIADNIVIVSTNPDLVKYLPLIFVINDRYEIQTREFNIQPYSYQAIGNSFLTTPDSLNNIVFAGFREMVFNSTVNSSINNNGVLSLDYVFTISSDDKNVYRLALDREKWESQDIDPVDVMKIDTNFEENYIVKQIVSGRRTNAVWVLIQSTLVDNYCKVVSPRIEPNLPLNPSDDQLIISNLGGDLQYVMAERTQYCYVWYNNLDGGSQIAVFNWRSQRIVNYLASVGSGFPPTTLHTFKPAFQSTNQQTLFNGVDIIDILIDTDSNTFTTQYYTPQTPITLPVLFPIQTQILGRIILNDISNSPNYVFVHYNTLYNVTVYFVSVDRSTNQYTVNKSVDFSVEVSIGSSIIVKGYRNFVVILCQQPNVHLPSYWVWINVQNLEITTVPIKNEALDLYQKLNNFWINDKYFLLSTGRLTLLEEEEGATAGSKFSFRVASNERPINQLYYYNFFLHNQEIVLDRELDKLSVTIKPFNVQPQLTDIALEIFRFIFSFRYRYSKGVEKLNPPIPKRDLPDFTNGLDEQLLCLEECNQEPCDDPPVVEVCDKEDKVCKDEVKKQQTICQKEKKNCFTKCDRSRTTAGQVLGYVGPDFTISDFLKLYTG